MSKHFDFGAATADLIDIAPDTPSCEIQFKSYGKRRRFSGTIRTVRCFRDNGLVWDAVYSPSGGAVLVVDGGGSLASALMGDMLAAAAAANGWAGAVVFGAVRDTALIETMDFGVKALGSNPRKSVRDGAGGNRCYGQFRRREFCTGALSLQR